MPGLDLRQEVSKFIDRRRSDVDLRSGGPCSSLVTHLTSAYDRASPSDPVDREMVLS